MSDQNALPEELDLLAAEYALGFLDGAEKLRAIELEATDEAFAQRVQYWQNQGEAWLLDQTPEAVGDHVWEGIAPIFGDAGANDNAETASENWAARAQQWRKRSYLSAAASVALAIALGTTLLMSDFRSGEGDAAGPIANNEAQSQPVERQLAVAQIASEDGAPLISAAFNPDAGKLRLRVAEFGETKKAPELWVLDAQGVPVSLGLVDDQQLSVELSDELRALLVEGAVIAVTLENRDGAPHDAPTGAILGTGKLVIL